MALSRTWTLPLIALALAPAAAANAQCEYEVIAVKAPWAPGKTVVLNDIANDGSAGGRVSVTIYSTPVFMTPDSTVTALPGGFFGGDVQSVSASGAIVGDIVSQTGGHVPGQWIDGQFVSLPTAFPLFNGYALGVGSGGLICGFADGGSIDLVGPVAWLDGRIIPLYDQLFDGFAVGAADDGTIGGWTATVGDYSAAFTWKDGVVTYLPSLGRSHEVRVTDVSGNGIMAGECFTFNSRDPWHAAVWRDGKVIDVGVLPGHARSRGYGVNVLGQAVGRSEHAIDSSLPDACFLWQDGVMSDLWALQRSPFAGHMTFALGINDRGEICGYGSDADGQASGLILKPIRTRPGDVTIDCHVNTNDLDSLFEFWGRTYAYDDGPGDLDGDHVVGPRDLALVLGDWGD